MTYKIISRGRINIEAGILEKELIEISLIDFLSVIQFDKPLLERDYINLYKYIFSKKPDIELRCYGFYAGGCDLRFLKHFPEITSFSADCLLEAINVDYVTSLSKLKKLKIGIYNLKTFDFFDHVNDGLKHLALQNTFSKKPSMKSISRFKNLESLYLEGQANGIEEVAHLQELQKIALRSISTKNLDFLKGLNKLWSVDIKLGGIKDFSALVSLPNLRYLELWQINKLADLTFISELKELQNLFLQSLKNIEELPPFDKASKLRRIYLENMKGLKM